MTKRKFPFHPILLGYWMIVSCLYYLYVSIKITTQNISLHSLLLANPLFTLGVLLTSIMMLQTGSLHYIARLSQSKNGLLGRYLFVLLFQQIMTGNLIGAGLVFFYRNQLENHSENPTSLEKGVVYVSCTICISLTLLILLILNRI